MPEDTIEQKLNYRILKLREGISQAGFKCERKEDHEAISNHLIQVLKDDAAREDQQKQ